MRRALVSIAGAALIVALTSPACADVFEIGDNGAVHVRTGASQVVWSGDTPPKDAPDVPDAAVTVIATPVVPADYRAALDQAAAQANISPDLLAALVARESAWRPGAVSAKGAVGLTQLMPATARALAVDPRDVKANLAGGAHYLRSLLDQFDGNIERALAAYNAGPGRVIRAGGVPAIAETKAYVATILDRLGPSRPVITAGVIR